MAREIICFLLIQCLICKVLGVYATPSIQQYLHLTNVPNTPHTITVPATHNAATSNQPPVITLSSTNYGAPSQPKPTTGLPSFSALALPNLLSSIQKLPEQPKTVVPQQTTSNIDSNLLNNLAIALQLLIVSNILNAPPADASAKSEFTSNRPCLDTKQNNYPYQYETVMPNSNFVGASNFAEPSLMQNYKPTKNVMALMSPYEALGSNSLYSDPIITQYGSSNSRKDFQSPYAMMDGSDLFAMNDLF